MYKKGAVGQLKIKNAKLKINENNYPFLIINS